MKKIMILKQMLLIILCFLTVSCKSNDEIIEDPVEQIDTCNISISSTDFQEDLTSIWNGINGALMTWTLSNNSLELSNIAAEGFRYLRFQEPLHTIYRENDEQGQPIYNWEVFDEALDRAVNAGFKLLIVLESTPNPLATNTSKYSWTNRNPPADYGEWYDFIQTVVLHCQERYGKNTIESWYWEVWNEPFASSLFYGTKEEYFKVHDYTVSAVKNVNPNLKIGGNLKFGTGEGADNPELFWMKDLIEHSLNEVNACTGESGTPLDFLSFHVYPLFPEDDVTDTPVLDNIDSTLKEIKALMKEYGVADIPIIISEWNSTVMISTLRDMSYNATFAVRACKIFLENQIPRLFFHALGDNPYSSKNGFNGSGGVFTASGIPKAVYHALSCMQKITGTRLKMETDDWNIDGLASRSDNKINIICANYETNPYRIYETDVIFQLTNIPQDYSKLNYMLYLIDQTNNNAYVEWKGLGSSNNLNQSEINALNKAAEFKALESEVIQLSNGIWNKNLVMPAHSVAFFEIELIN